MQLLENTGNYWLWKQWTATQNGRGTAAPSFQLQAPNSCSMGITDSIRVPGRAATGLTAAGCPGVVRFRLPTKNPEEPIKKAGQETRHRESSNDARYDGVQRDA